VITHFRLPFELIFVIGTLATSVFLMASSTFLSSISRAAFFAFSAPDLTVFVLPASSILSKATLQPGQQNGTSLPANFDLSLTGPEMTSPLTAQTVGTVSFTSSRANDETESMAQRASAKVRFFMGVVYHGSVIRGGQLKRSLTRPFAGDGLAVVRLGRRTKQLAPTLSEGAIVVIDHSDIDAVAASMLVRTKPRAVINCQPFVSGRYPNRGPLVLLDAGILLFEVGKEHVDLFSCVTDGELLRLSNDQLSKSNGAIIAPLSPLYKAELLAQLSQARTSLDTALTDFAQNTLAFLEKSEQRALLLDSSDVPEIATVIEGRHVLVVVRGDGYEADLDRLAFYLKEQRPIVLAVDGAADALLARGIRPALILGDMDSVSDAALLSGAELLVHAYPDGRAPGRERLDALGAHFGLFPIAGTSEDAALLLAYEKGADLIVAVGTHSNLEDFLDKGRGGMASTFLVRLKVGSRLVDARGVSRLYETRRRVGPLFGFLALSALFPMVVLMASTPWGQFAWRTVLFWFREHFSR
jgi:uncharacterized membrane-anchored protein